MISGLFHYSHIRSPWLISSAFRTASPGRTFWRRSSVGSAIFSSVCVSWPSLFHPPSLKFATKFKPNHLSVFRNSLYRHPIYFCSISSVSGISVVSAKLFQCLISVLEIIVPILVTGFDGDLTSAFSRGFWHPVDFRDEYIKRLLLHMNYYILFCANYKVGESFEFSGEEMNNKLILKFHALRVSDLKVLLAYIVAFFDLIWRIKKAWRNFAQ